MSWLFQDHYSQPHLPSSSILFSTFTDIFHCVPKNTRVFIHFLRSANHICGSHLTILLTLLSVSGQMNATWEHWTSIGGGIYIMTIWACHLSVYSIVVTCTFFLVSKGVCFRDLYLTGFTVQGNKYLFDFSVQVSIHAAKSWMSPCHPSSSSGLVVSQYKLRRLTQRLKQDKRVECKHLGNVRTCLWLALRVQSNQPLSSVL